MGMGTGMAKNIHGYLCRTLNHSAKFPELNKCSELIHILNECLRIQIGWYLDLTLGVLGAAKVEKYLAILISNSSQMTPETYQHFPSI